MMHSCGLKYRIVLHAGSICFHSCSGSPLSQSTWLAATEIAPQMEISAVPPSRSYSSVESRDSGFARCVNLRLGIYTSLLGVWLFQIIYRFVFGPPQYLDPVTILFCIGVMSWLGRNSAI